MSQKTHWSVIVAYFYCIFILLANVSAFGYTDYKANQIEKVYNEHKQQQTEQVSPSDQSQFPVFDSAKFFKESLKPITNAGEAAKTATPILILNIGVGLITSTLLLLPKLLMNKVENFVSSYGADFNVDAYQKFVLIIFACNLILIFFDFFAVKSYCDFANALVKS